MSVGLQILIPVLTACATLIATTVLNYFFAIPKKFKKQRDSEHQQILEKIDSVETHLSDKLQEQDTLQEQMKQDIILLKSGNQAIIKNELKLRYEKWIKLGYAPIDAKDDLERMYNIYHKLGANGVMDHLREQFLNLPDERVVRKHVKSDD